MAAALMVSPQTGQVFVSSVTRSLAFLSCPLRCSTWNLLGKTPLVALGIRCAIPTMPVLRVGGLLDDGGTGLSCALEMLVDALHHDVETLGCLAEPLRIAIARGRTPHHHRSTSKLHRGVIDLAILSAHPDAKCTESKRLGQEYQRAADVLVIEIRRDCHGPPRR